MFFVLFNFINRFKTVFRIFGINSQQVKVNCWIFSLVGSTLILPYLYYLGDTYACACEFITISASYVVSMGQQLPLLSRSSLHSISLQGLHLVLGRILNKLFELLECIECFYFFTNHVNQHPTIVIINEKAVDVWWWFNLIDRVQERQSNLKK